MWKHFPRSSLKREVFEGSDIPKPCTHTPSAVEVSNSCFPGEMVRQWKACHEQKANPQTRRPGSTSGSFLLQGKESVFSEDLLACVKTGGILNEKMNLRNCCFVFVQSYSSNLELSAVQQSQLMFPAMCHG